MYGFTAEKIRAMSQPVLVRVRTSKINRKEFAVEANQDDKLAMTATEKAKADAGRLTPDLMSRFSPGEDGDLLVAANRPFIMGFLQSLGDAEAAQYSTKSGEPTGTLIARIQAAVFAKAYEDERLLELMADTAKPENANLVKALAAAAPEFILARESNENGAQEASSQLADSIGLSLDNEAVRTLIDAANIVRQAKRENMGVAEYVSQMGLFGDIDPGVAAMAVFIAQNNRSSKRLGVAFKAMAQFVRRELEHGSSFDMFGERTVSMADVVLAANNAIEKEYGEGKFSIGTPNPQPGSLFESAIDDAANKAATSPTNSLPDPSQAQYESGNYRKGHISLYGLRISIENPRGSTRSGTDPDGKEWSIAMSDHYGYINGSEGADGDHVDVYVGKANNSDMVYVVDQIDQKTGRFDEHKVMLGYRSKKQATDAYKRNFTAGWRVGEVTGAPVDVFKEWLDSGKTRMPFIKFVQSKGKKARRIFEAAEHYGSIDTGLFA
ncbi:MAG: hypothetical protein IBX50_19405 [Marinospirillum sp.]|nr:hypothetical protein [Marinospirillum sp.]